MRKSVKDGGRRRFLVGLLTGAGVAMAVGLLPKKAKAEVGTKKGPEPILYRRTKDVERYYRTLYY